MTHTLLIELLKAEEEWDQVIDVHLKGCYTLVRHAM